MSELKCSLGPLSYPTDPTKRSGGQLDLQWFGFSRYSDSGRGRLGEQVVTVRRFRSHEECRVFELQLRRALENWKKVDSHPNIQAFQCLLKPNSHSPLCMLVTMHMAYNVLDYTQANPNVDKGMLMYDVASAIAHLHKQTPPITHGNIKASNILVDEEGRVYVSDIGIRLLLSTPKQPGFELRWTAPERVLNDEEPHITQCDVWSLAATVVEVYTGRRPFDRYSSEANVVLAMREGEFPFMPEADEGASINEKMWGLLTRCWSYKPSMRPPMAEILPQI